MQPLRLGMIASDLGAGVLYRPDAITIMYIPPNSPHTTVSEAMPQPSSELKVTRAAELPDDVIALRFSRGTARRHLRRRPARSTT